MGGRGNDTGRAAALGRHHHVETILGATLTHGHADPQRADGGGEGVGAAGGAEEFFGVVAGGEPTGAGNRGCAGAGAVFVESAFLGVVELADGGEHIGAGAVEIGLAEIQEGNVFDKTPVEVGGAAGFVEEDRAGKLDGGEFLKGAQGPAWLGVGHDGLFVGGREGGDVGVIAQFPTEDRIGELFGVGGGDAPGEKEILELDAGGARQRELAALVFKTDFDGATLGRRVSRKTERIGPAFGGGVEAVGGGAELFEDRERGFEGGIGFLAEATGIRFAGLDDEIVGSFFQKNGERESGENERDHHDHEDGRALRARFQFLGFGLRVSEDGCASRGHR